jgi:diaminohydroxyphosphoribosylaminopyrimidine deaminase/5-amino-6-(5-phosphoribosylamino)uracil reductase
VIDRRMELNKQSNVFDQSVETFIFNEIEFNVDGKNSFIALEDFDRYVPQYILYQLYLQDIQSVIIEGGAHTLQTFIDAGLWDEARIFTGKTVLTKGIKSPQITGIIADESLIGDDRLQVLHNK